MSSTETVLAPATVAVIEEGGFFVHQGPGGTDVTSNGLDLRFGFHRDEGGPLRVDFRERGDAPRPEVEATGQEDVERWLMLELRGDVRRSRGFREPPVGPPDDPPAPGFTVEHAGFDVLVSDAGGPRMRFFGMDRTNRIWVRWTWAADVPLADLAARLTGAAGW